MIATKPPTTIPAIAPAGSFVGPGVVTELVDGCSPTAVLDLVFVVDAVDLIGADVGEVVGSDKPRLAVGLDDVSCVSAVVLSELVVVADTLAGPAVYPFSVQYRK